MSKECKALRRNYYGAIAPARNTCLKAIISKEAGFDATEQQNLEGTLNLYHRRVKTLFDIHALNSFIAHYLLQELGLRPKP